MKNRILSIDQSTSGTKALLFGPEGELLARRDLPHRQITPKSGWVEHDPEDLYRNTVDAAKALFRETGADPAEVAAIGISNQRETVLAWDKATGEPVCNAIVWQCARAESLCRELEKDPRAARIPEKTGLALSPYFSAAKLCWMMRNVPGAAEKAARGALCCGTVDSWLVWRLTGGASFRTDYSNASRTELFDISALRWDEELCALFDVSPAALPEPCPSDAFFGETDFEGLFPAPVPIRGVLGDSHGALFAQGCTEPGSAKVTYGTGSSVMMNTGRERIAAENGLCASIAWGRAGEVLYVLEGNVNYTGSVVKWLVDKVGLLQSSREAGALAASVPSTGGVYLVPAFSGLGAPYWDGDARAILCGMSTATGKAEIVRAAEECIAYQVADIVALMNDQAGVSLTRLSGDGGPTRDAFLMQFQADMLGRPLGISAIEEASGAGAAYMAGIAAGLYGESVLHRPGRAFFTPQMPEETRSDLLCGWHAAVERARRK